MQFERVLVIAKKTVIDRYAGARPDPKFVELLQRNDPLVARARLTHEAHRDAVRHITEVLRGRGLRYRVVFGASKRAAAAHDLVISVGGDGTLLDAAHCVVDQPVLAVNSFPETSIGYFCGATMENFAARLESILAGEARVTSLNRIAVSIDDRRLHYPALNDILFAHTVPAATTSYILKVDGLEEQHLSSGVWVSTAAGSTAAIRAAGGVRQPIASRDLQYKVRELFRPPQSDHELTGGIIADKVEILSKTSSAAVFMDGHRVRFRVGYGDLVRVESNSRPMSLYLFSRR